MGEPTQTTKGVTPLPLDNDHWRCRWLHLDGGLEMHRVSSIEWQDGEMIYGDGVTMCERRGHLHMPGIFSRMDADRCPQCCAALGIPSGQGAPFNVDIDEPQQ